VVGREEKRRAYVDAVLREIAAMACNSDFAGRRVGSIYFGGGTPSLLAAGDVARVLETAREHFAVDDDAEVSLESNPDGLSLEWLKEARSAGVHRLTLGWQSLHDAHLRTLGRTQRREENLAAYRMAREAGFENLAVDLIFGIPGQRHAEWRRDLEETAALQPEHVSAYELTLEEGTRFLTMHEHGRLTLPDEETRAAMFESTDEILATGGVARYEISNFARPGFECRHNCAGWRSGDLLGVGASAASHVSNRRWTNVADLDEYVRRIDSRENPASPEEILDDATWAAEDLYLGLRLIEGIDAKMRLANVSEPGKTRLSSVIENAISNGLIASDDSRVHLTRSGLLLADTVFEELLVQATAR
jgi:oxygen-independent coproporphyrinogen-3 oxidase